MAEAGLLESSNISSELVFSLGGVDLDLAAVVGEQSVDPLLEGVQLCKTYAINYLAVCILTSTSTSTSSAYLIHWLLEDVADHELGAVVSVQLAGGLKEGLEGIVAGIALPAQIKLLEAVSCSVMFCRGRPTSSYPLFCP